MSAAVEPTEDTGDSEFDFMQLPSKNHSRESSESFVVVAEGQPQSESKQSDVLNNIFSGKNDSVKPADKRAPPGSSIFDQSDSDDDDDHLFTNRAPSAKPNISRKKTRGKSSLFLDDSDENDGYESGENSTSDLVEIAFGKNYTRKGLNGDDEVDKETIENSGDGFFLCDDSSKGAGLDSKVDLDEESKTAALDERHEDNPEDAKKSVLNLLGNQPERGPDGFIVEKSTAQTEAEDDLEWERKLLAAPEVQSNAESTPVSLVESSQSGSSSSEDSDSDSDSSSDDGSDDNAAQAAKSMGHIPEGCREIFLRKIGAEPLGFDVAVKQPAQGQAGMTATVRSVKENGLAAREGLQPGDSILQIGDMKLASVYYKAQCLELLRDPLVKLIVKPAPPGYEYKPKPRSRSTSPVRRIPRPTKKIEQEQSQEVSFLDTLKATAAKTYTTVKTTTTILEKHVLDLAATMADEVDKIKIFEDIDDEISRNRARETNVPGHYDEESKASLRRRAKRFVSSDCAVNLDRRKMTGTDEDPADVPLGFELELIPGAAGLVARIKSVSREGLAVHTLGNDGLRKGDELKKVNGKSLSDLPNGPAGRIYLFRLLAATEVQLELTISRLVPGVEDIVTKEFFPDEPHGAGAAILAQT